MMGADDSVDLSHEPANKPRGVPDQPHHSECETRLGSPKPEQSPWSFHQIASHGVKLRGGGCAASLLCDIIESQPPPRAAHDPHSSRGPEIQTERCDADAADRQQGQDQEQDQHQDQGQEEDEETQKEELRNGTSAHITWPGWAELENDPDIFTILLQEWGVPNLEVNEIIDMADLIDAKPQDTLGLIFLSRYTPPDHATNTSSHLSTQASLPPWFANQISKFSCGTVALMNILMNTQDQDQDLSDILRSFQHDTADMNAKSRGIALDHSAQFRDIHNSFSTKLDRMIVDLLLKEDVQKYKLRIQAQARQARQGDAKTTARGTKRKRRATNFSKRRVRKPVQNDDEETGFHFVAYLSAHGAVWRLDGMQPAPKEIGLITSDLTWLNVAAADLMVQMNDAYESGQECSLIRVSRRTDQPLHSDEEQHIPQIERHRKQEDWAPFIEHMLRLHAERGDLQELLEL